MKKALLLSVSLAALLGSSAFAADTFDQDVATANQFLQAINVSLAASAANGVPLDNTAKEIADINTTNRQEITQAHDQVVAASKSVDDADAKLNGAVSAAGQARAKLLAASADYQTTAKQVEQKLNEIDGLKKTYNDAFVQKNLKDKIATQNQADLNYKDTVAQYGANSPQAKDALQWQTQAHQQAEAAPTEGITKIQQAVREYNDLKATLDSKNATKNAAGDELKAANAQVNQVRTQTLPAARKSLAAANDRYDQASTKLTTAIGKAFQDASAEKTAGEAKKAEQQSTAAKSAPALSGGTQGPLAGGLPAAPALATTNAVPAQGKLQAAAPTIAQGGGNLRAAAPTIAQGGGNAVPVQGAANAVPSPAAPLITGDGAGLIGTDSAGLKPKMAAAFVGTLAAPRAYKAASVETPTDALHRGVANLGADDAKELQGIVAHAKAKGTASLSDQQLQRAGDLLNKAAKQLDPGTVKQLSTQAAATVAHEDVKAAVTSVLVQRGATNDPALAAVARKVALGQTLTVDDVKRCNAAMARVFKNLRVSPADRKNLNRIMNAHIANLATQRPPAPVASAPPVGIPAGEKPGGKPGAPAAPATAAPAGKTNGPPKVANQASKPDAHAAKPDARTAKPTATTAKPTVTAAKPNATTAKPTATTAKPNATTAKPTTTASKPPVTAPTPAKRPGT